jgi:hypothetical protein
MSKRIKPFGSFHANQSIRDKTRAPIIFLKGRPCAAGCDLLRNRCAERRRNQLSQSSELHRGKNASITDVDFSIDSHSIKRRDEAIDFPFDLPPQPPRLAAC